MSEGMAQRIKELRKEKGLTLEQVAEVVGVGKSTVRKWETGMIANMKRDKIASLAKALGTTPAYLMGWELEEKKVPLSDLPIAEEEKLMLQLFRQIPEDRQQEALDLLRIALKIQQRP
jgi:repressor LexA